MTILHGFNHTQAEKYFSAWNKMLSTKLLLESAEKLARWRYFFEKLASIPHPANKTKQRNDLICDQFRIFATSFAIANESYRKKGLAVNIWRAVGIGHDELRNSAALSWILDRFGDHGQGENILAGLLELISKDRQIGTIVEDVRNNNYWTRTESLPLGGAESRVDIEIESSKFLLFIEVKVRAPETGNQLQRYVALARSKAAGRNWFVIFLTPDGRKPSDHSLWNDVVALSWKQIANVIYQYIEKSSSNNFAGHILRQFADHAIQLR